jgi:hypothetical protein
MVVRSQSGTARMVRDRDPAQDRVVLCPLSGGAASIRMSRMFRKLKQGTWFHTDAKVQRHNFITPPQAASKLL